MREIPILFSGEMVRAILDGRKTQTRRIVKGRALEWLAPDMFTPEYVALADVGLSPYGFAGDRLWVRESFWGCDAPGYGDQPCVVYDDEWHGKEYRPAEVRPWARKFGRIPSIHMPRDCSRITLEITGVRVERLKQISSDDCFAEGIDVEGADYTEGENYANAGSPVPPERWAFSGLWNSTGGDWEADPWVWVIEFKRVEA